MSAPIVTGADIFRAKKILTAAEIFALDTTPVLLVPGRPGKTLLMTNYFGKLYAGSQVFTPASGASAIPYYGPTTAINGAVGDTLATLISGNTNNSVNVATIQGLGLNPPPDLTGLGIFMNVGAAGFNAGSALTATVDPAHKGLLYAANDTGTIQVPGDSIDPTYTVTGTGAGGLVTTVTVAGGTGVTVGGSFATTVVTGSGDGSLKLNIVSITPLGNGTVEINVLYQPI